MQQRGHLVFGASRHPREIANPDAALITSQATYLAVAEGRLNVATAFMTGKLKVKGNMQLLMRFQQIFHRL